MDKSKNRDLSIELLKAIAALLITNSHMNEMYGSWSALATGGAIGDVLFFFCSGYTLFWGRDMDFANWYKRRINRILPTLFAWSLLHLSFSMNPIGYRMPIDLGAGWFFPCIFIYYVLLFPIKLYFKDKLWYVFGASFVVILVWYVIFGIGDADKHNMYGATYFKWIHFFPFMLLGSIVGLKRKNETTANTTFRQYKLFPTLVILLFSIVAFYSLCAFKKFPQYDYIQLLSLLPLISIVYYLWRLCNTSLAGRILNNKYLGWVFLFIGSLCLEIYVGQGEVFTTCLNHLFPLNIIIIMLGVLVYAYFLRCCARLWSQTFREESYDWRTIFKTI